MCLKLVSKDLFLGVCELSNLKNDSSLPVRDTGLNNAFTFVPSQKATKTTIKELFLKIQNHQNRKNKRGDNSNEFLETGKQAEVW